MQKILYVSFYPASVFKEIIEYGTFLSQAAQKFNSLIAEGLIASKCSVDVVRFDNALSVSRRKFYPSSVINENGITFYILAYTTLFWLRKVFSMLMIKSFMKDYLHQNSDVILLVDALQNKAGYVAAIAKRANVKVITIVTDLPELLKIQGIFPLHSKLMRKSLLHGCEVLFQSTDAFVFLTEAMNKRINHSGVPYIVIEGIVSSNVTTEQFKTFEPVTDAKGTRIIIYAGAISDTYGIGTFIQAFDLLNMDNLELHLYGSGDENTIAAVQAMSSRNQRLKYMGIVTNEEIMMRLREADLLVNPRPTDDEYTMYSFPSKNIEYMYSGTPLLTTRLKGIPDEYYSYTLTFDSADLDGYVAGLNKAMLLSKEELKTNGASAHEFVIMKKNSLIQAQRIIDLVRLIDEPKKSASIH